MGPRALSRPDTARDGAMTGPNRALYRRLATLAPALEVRASGGVRSLDDVVALTLQGVSGVILGRALLQGEFTLEDAFDAAAKAGATC